MRNTILAAFILLAVTAPCPAADDDADAYRSAYELVLDEQWPAAVAAFTRFVEQHPQSAWADDAAFWRCYARERAGMEPATTFDCYLELRERWPDSEWADDAQRAAVALARRLARDGHDEYLERVRGFQVDDDLESTLAVLAALAEVGDEASVQAILDRLARTDDARLRAELVQILEEVETPAARDAIVRLARSDPSPEVRETAIQALADGVGASQFELLAELARSDPNGEVRESAVMALADVYDPRTLALLEGLVRAGDVRVAEAAVHAIGESDLPEAAALLEKLLRDSSLAGLRQEIAWAVADGGGPRALALLTELAHGPDAELAETAVSALGELDQRDAVRVLAEIAHDGPSSRLRVTAAEALTEHDGDDAFAAQLRLLRAATDARVREAVAEHLGDRADDGAIASLADAARLDPDQRVREAATSALGEIGSARARDALIGLLQQ